MTERYLELLGELKAAVYMADSAGNITYASKYNEKLAGISLDKIIGRSFHQLVDKKSLQASLEGFAKLMKGASVAVELKLGSGRIGQFYSEPLRDKAGKVVGVYGVAWDITDRVRAENTLIRSHAQLKKRVAAQARALSTTNEKLYKSQSEVRLLKSQLLMSEEKERKRMASHIHDQIGQDLLVTKLKLQKLRSNSLTGSKFKTVGQIIGIMDGIVNKTREMTSEMGSPILYELGLKEAVSEFVKKMGTSSDICFYCDFNGQPAKANPDSLALMYRCTCELIVNSVKHSEAESVVVAIKKTDDRVSVTVRDDGVGFDMASKRQGSGKGTGNGLSGMKESLAEIGGNVEIFSNPGECTEVIIKAPFKID